MRLIITGGLLAAIIVNGSCALVPSFDHRLGSIVKPYTFSIVQWELKTIPHEIGEWLFGQRGGVDSEVDTVVGYFSSTERIETLESELEAIHSGDRQGDTALLEAELDKLRQQTVGLAATVARIIEGQIRETLVELGIFNPLIKVKVSFPPIDFKLERPPHLLVVSPRDKIESMREIRLKQSLSLEEIEDIESHVDQLDVSSLVVELGGFGGTFPTFVSNNSGLRFSIDTAVEEWLHQYLALAPLGFLYLLDSTGVSRNYDIATINETVASMVSEEIGSMVYASYYSHLDSSENQGQKPEFDFNQEMRQIRMAVDEYLARGKVEEAERYMEEKRQYLAAKGYYIRKLNQAYFAFYGTYADSPTSISPIGVELKQLRDKSASVKDFLERVAGMTSREDLRMSVE